MGARITAVRKVPIIDETITDGSDDADRLDADGNPDAEEETQFVEDIVASWDITPAIESWLARKLSLEDDKPSSKITLWQLDALFEDCNAVLKASHLVPGKNFLLGSWRYSADDYIAAPMVIKNVTVANSLIPTNSATEPYGHSYYQGVLSTWRNILKVKAADKTYREAIEVTLIRPNRLPLSEPEDAEASDDHSEPHGSGSQESQAVP